MDILNNNFQSQFLLQFFVQTQNINCLQIYFGRNKLEFATKEQAINFAKKNNIDYYIIEPQKRKIIKKSYADNFLKNN